MIVTPVMEDDVCGHDVGYVQFGKKASTFHSPTCNLFMKNIRTGVGASLNSKTRRFKEAELYKKARRPPSWNWCLCVYVHSTF